MRNSQRTPSQCVFCGFQASDPQAKISHVLHCPAQNPDQIHCQVCQKDVARRSLQRHYNSVTHCKRQELLRNAKSYPVPSQTREESMEIDSDEDSMHAAGGGNIPEVNSEVTWQRQETMSEWIERNMGTDEASLQSLCGTFRPHGEQATLAPTTNHLIHFRWKRLQQKGAIDDLLHILTDPAFDRSQVPPSVYHLDKLEEEGFPMVGQYQFFDPSISEPIFMVNILELLTLILGDSELRQQMKFAFEEDDLIKHPCNSKGWAEYEVYRSLVETRHHQKTLLLCPVFFLDEYKHEDFRNGKLNALYMTLANFSVAILNSTQHKYLIALLPPGADLDRALREIVVNPCRELERGTTLMINGKSEWVSGSVYAFVGDHVSMAKVSGKKSALSSRPSRYTDCRKEKLDETSYESTTSSTFLDAEIIEQELNDVLSMSKAKQLEVLNKYGLERQGALFECRWFANRYFLRFGMCYMHASIEGNFSRHIKYLLARVGCHEEVNRLATSLSTSYPTLEPLNEGIVAISKSKKVGRNILSLRTFTAGQIESFLQISPFIFLGRIPARLYSSWMDHLETDTEMREVYYTCDELPLLQTEIDYWRYGMKSTLEGTEGEELLKAGFTFKYPNFEAEAHWSQLFGFLGPLYFMNTQLWETLHSQAKIIGDITNRQNPRAHVLKIICRRYCLSFAATNSKPEDDPRERKKDMTPFGKPVKTVAWGTSCWREEIAQIRVLMNRKTHLSTHYGEWSGIYLGGVKVYPGAYLLVADYRSVGRLHPSYVTANGVDKMMPSDRGTAFIGCLKNVITLLLQNGQSTAWARLEIFKRIEDLDRDLRMPCFTSVGTTWLPLLEPHNISVRRQVQVLPHPLRPGVCCHNIFIRKEIKAFE